MDGIFGSGIQGKDGQIDFEEIEDGVAIVI